MSTFYVSVVFELHDGRDTIIASMLDRVEAENEETAQAILIGCATKEFSAKYDSVSLVSCLSLAET